MKQKALEHFRANGGGLNCAQAVLKAFEATHGVAAEMIEAFKKYGGGRAEGSLCGALYAAQTLVDDPELADEVAAKFAEIAGSVHCKEIRGAKVFTCSQCVETAAGLVQDTTPK